MWISLIQIGHPKIFQDQNSVSCDLKWKSSLFCNQCRIRQIEILSPRSHNFLSLFETHPHINVFGTSAYYGGVIVENVATLMANSKNFDTWLA